jgi:hypothetical protein
MFGNLPLVVFESQSGKYFKGYMVFSGINVKFDNFKPSLTAIGHSNPFFAMAVELLEFINDYMSPDSGVYMPQGSVEWQNEMLEIGYCDRPTVKMYEPYRESVDFMVTEYHENNFE